MLVMAFGSMDVKNFDGTVPPPLHSRSEEQVSIDEVKAH
jgi:hypothetical protein